jgi:hypothetical protein
VRTSGGTSSAKATSTRLGGGPCFWPFLTRMPPVACRAGPSTQRQFTLDKWAALLFRRRTHARKHARIANARMPSAQASGRQGQQ